ncbi:MAG TPA: alpha/beta fold hydrolase, partial [Chloroflexaceae bacterium]|nr:alpha/beta fold hydrolase [Chloroflexaceae bacterium]
TQGDPEGAQAAPEGAAPAQAAVDPPTPEGVEPSRQAGPAEAPTVRQTAGARWRIATPTGPISYLASGEGPPLLLLHGFGATARIWDDTRAALADLRAAYALDLPGFGESPPRAAAPTLPALADEVLACADALGLARFDLLGHSLGAAVAAVLAARAPGRVGRLVGVSLGARVAPELQALGLGRAPLDLTLGLARPLLDLWQPVSRALMQSPPVALGLGSIVLHGPPASAELWRAYLADHAAADPRAYLTSLTAVGDPALLAALPAIAAPTLLVAGREDRVARLAETTAAHAMLPDSRFIALDGCGHMPMLERPAVFHLALRRFLAG